MGGPRARRVTAVAVLAVVSIVSVPSAASATGAASSGRLRYRTYRVGDCATWNQADRLGSLGPSVKVVKCTKPHLMEIAGSVKFARRTSFPTQEQWVTIGSQGECLAVLERYLGQKFDPAGRFAAGTVHPLADGWAAGLRTVWCTLSPSRRSDSATVEPMVGGVRGQDQTRLWDVGACVRSAPFAVVACTEEHTNEVVGNVTVTGFTDAPSAEQLIAAIGAECRAVATTYLGGRVPADVGIAALGIAAGSWAAGRRIAQCVVGRVSPGGWVSMTGSLR